MYTFSKLMEGKQMRKVHPTFLICALTIMGLTLEVATASGPRLRDLPSAETGPIIELLRPVIDKPISVPIEIEVQFIPRRAPVDVSSVKVTLLKVINLDITERVKPYTSSAGIHIPSANLPSGRHDLRITIADTEGNISNKQVSLIIL